MVGQTCCTSAIRSAFVALPMLRRKSVTTAAGRLTAGSLSSPKAICRTIVVQSPPLLYGKTDWTMLPRREPMTVGARPLMEESQAA